MDKDSKQYFPVTRKRIVTVSELELGDEFQVELKLFGKHLVTVEKIKDKVITCFFGDVVIPVGAIFLQSNFDNYYSAILDYLDNKLFVAPPKFGLESKDIKFRLPTILELYGDKFRDIEPEFYSIKNGHHKCRLYTQGYDLMNYLLADITNEQYNYVSRHGLLGSTSRENAELFPNEMAICPVMEFHLPDNS